MTGLWRFISAGVAVTISLTAAAVPARAIDAPYDEDLTRLAEVLGSLHYLRNLCGERGSAWRGQMEQLLATENAEPDRRARLTASFNRGYRTFDSVYTACTASAVEAIDRYMLEGENLSREIATKYGN